MNKNLVPASHTKRGKGFTRYSDGIRDAIADAIPDAIRDAIRDGMRVPGETKGGPEDA